MQNCAKCGASVSDDVCPQCGAPVQPVPQVESVPPVSASPYRSRHRGFALGLIALLSSIAVFVLFLFEVMPYFLSHVPWSSALAWLWVATVVVLGLGGLAVWHDGWGGKVMGILGILIALLAFEEILAVYQVN